MKFAHHVSTRMNYCSGSLKPLRCLKIRGLHLAPPFLVEDHVPVAVDAHRNGLLKVFRPAIFIYLFFYTKMTVINGNHAVNSFPVSRKRSRRLKMS